MKENLDQRNVKEVKRLGEEKTQSNQAVKEFQPKLKPSQLMKLKKTNLFNKIQKREPKIIKLNRTQNHTFFVDSELQQDLTLFKAVPSMVFFTGYQDLKPQKRILKLRNMDGVARRVKIKKIKTKQFQIKQIFRQNKQSSSKIAPGLCAVYEITFYPLTRDDQSYDLVIQTEREDFTVPLVSICSKCLLSFPDVIDFGQNCPVKYKTEKVVNICNKGEKRTRWKIRLPKDFTCTQNEGEIDSQSSQQITLSFFPVKTQHYQEKGLFMYDGDQCYFDLVGQAVNQEVYLSTPKLTMNDCFISLENTQTFFLINNSSVKIDFTCKKFFNREIEESQKKQMLKRVHQEEQEQLLCMYQRLEEENEFNEEIVDEESLQQHLEIKQKLINQKKRAEMLIRRKYQAMKEKIKNQDFHMEDEYFTINPKKGTIWPKNKSMISIKFQPSQAIFYQQDIFFEVTCQEERLRLGIEGKGLGPSAFLSNEKIFISEIFINQEQEYDFFIENSGEIDCELELTNNKNDRIVFDVEEGLVEVGDRLYVKMKYKSQLIGSFLDVFKWKIKGNDEPLLLVVKSQVRSPKFQLSDKKIDFGEISYKFKEERVLNFKNISPVPFNFKLQIEPRDNDGEFEIIPQNSQILPNENIQIKINFTPKFKKNYSKSLVMKAEQVDDQLMKIPINAVSRVPKVTIVPKELDFGEIFLRCTAKQKLTLSNESNFYAKFKIHQLDSKYDNICEITPSIKNGQIQPHSKINVDVTIKTLVIKNLEVDLMVEIVSDDKKFDIIKVKAISIGPIVEISKLSINFGEIDVLRKYVKTLTITNKSRIEADFYCFTKKSNSIFKTFKNEYLLKPFQSMEVQLVCYADDSGTFKDVIYFVIKEGIDKEVKVYAKAVGTTIFCREIKNVNFGRLFTHTNQVQELFIENKGRKEQQLKWKSKDKEGLNPFTIYPQEIVLPSKTGMIFQFRAFSKFSGEIQKNFILEASNEEQNRSSHQISSLISANFVQPSISLYPSQPHFEFSCDVGKNDKICKNMSIKSLVDLPIHFELQIQEPFQVKPQRISLLSRESKKIKLTFNPHLDQDFNIKQIKENLIINFLHNPRIQQIPVTAQYWYPNVSINTQEIDFHAVQENASKRMHLEISNPWKLPSKFKWCVYDQNDFEKLENQLTIKPSEGIIEQDQKEIVEVVYTPNADSVLNTQLVCTVDQGPEYLVQVKGHSSNITYKLNLPKKKEPFSLGTIMIGQTKKIDFEIVNTSDLEINYKINIMADDGVKKLFKKFVRISPQNGKIEKQSKQKIRIQVFCIVQSKMMAQVQIQVAHFQIQSFPLSFMGRVQRLNLNHNSLFPVDQEINLVREFLEIQQSKIGLNTKQSMLFKSLSTEKVNTLSKDQNILQDLILNTYYIDLGVIVAGNSVKKVIKVVNIEKQKINFEIINDLNKKQGLSFSQDKFVEVKKFVKVTMTFITSKDYKSGQHEFEIIIKIKNGCRYKLIVKADVCVPQMTLSKNLVDFGVVRVGTRKVITIRLENDKILDCQWYIRSPSAYQSKKGQQFFLNEKNGGFLKSGEKKNLEIFFEPNQEKIYAQKMIFQFKDSSKKISLTCRGRGEKTKLIFEPEMINFNSVLPNSQVTRQLKITNTSSFDIKVLTPQLRDVFDEEQLKIIDQFQEKKFSYLEISKFLTFQKKLREIKDHNLKLKQLIDGEQDEDQILKLRDQLKEMPVEIPQKHIIKIENRQNLILLSDWKIEDKEIDTINKGRFLKIISINHLKEEYKRINEVKKVTNEQMIEFIKSQLRHQEVDAGFMIILDDHEILQEEIFKNFILKFFENQKINFINLSQSDQNQNFDYVPNKSDNYFDFKPKKIIGINRSFVEDLQEQFSIIKISSDLYDDQILNFVNQLIPQEKFLEEYELELPKPKIQYIYQKIKQFEKDQLIKIFQEENQIESFDLKAHSSTTINLVFQYGKIKKIKSNLFFTTFTDLLSKIIEPIPLKYTAKVMFPDINRNFKNLFFKNRKRVKNSKKYFNNFFDVNEQKYKFGPIGMIDKKHDLMADESLKAELRVTNPTPFDIKVNFSLESKNDFFKIPNSQMALKPQETLPFEFYANPQEMGIFEDVLQVLIEGNPQSLDIPLSFEAVNNLLQVSSKEIDFGKVVLEKKSVNFFSLKNESKMIQKWSIINYEELQSENFKIDRVEGSLFVNQEEKIEVTFYSKVPKKINTKLKIKVESLKYTHQINQKIHEVNLKAEGFQVIVEIVGLKGDEMSLEYGQIECRRSYDKHFGIKNKGIYPIKIKLDILDENFQVKNKDFEIKPKSDHQVTIKYMTEIENHYLKGQHKMMNIFIFNEGEEDHYQMIEMFCTLESFLGHCQIEPSNQLNFGALLFTESCEKSFKIINTSPFTIYYSLYDSSQQSQQSILDKINKYFKGEEKLKSNKKQVKIGQFTLESQEGMIPSGQTEEINVKFEGIDNFFHELKLGIEISNRKNQQKPIQYLLQGESCMPSLETKKFNHIFEEQVVTESMNSTGVNLTDVIQGNIFSIKDNLFHFGNVIPNKHPGGITERFKLINNGKVKVKVNLTIKEIPNKNFAFKIQPNSVSINPHEFSYVKLTFQPDYMTTYEGRFEAIIETNQDIENNFQFRVMGRGVLPSLKYDVKDKVIDFGRMRLGSQSSQTIKINNRGLIPASTFIQLLSENFKVKGKKQLSIMPHDSNQFVITFSPLKIGFFEEKFSLVTLKNPYENFEFKIKGQCFYEDLTLVDIEDNLVDFGEIADCNQSKLAKQYFHLHNHSKQVIRYAWQMSNPNVKIRPQIGHIQPLQQKKLKITMYKQENNEVDMTMKMSYQKIELTEVHNLIWDSFMQSQQTIKSMSLDSKVEEPDYKVIDSEQKMINLQIKAKIGVPQIELVDKRVDFQKTMIYSSRLYPLEITNISEITVTVEHHLQNEDENSVFSILPDSLVIQPGKVEQMMVKFHPVDFDQENYKSLLIINLLNSQQTHKIILTGRATRPICHFELETNNTGSEDKILEIISSGYRKKCFRKFCVQNTSDEKYNFQWRIIDKKTNIIKCLTNKGTIKAGKKFEMIFEFTPLMTQNSNLKQLFEFYIPKFNLRQKFLIKTQVLQPKIFLSKSKVNFGPVMLLSKAKEYLDIKNLDDEISEFKFSIKSLNKRKYNSKILTVSPEKGVIKKKSKTNILIQFKPLSEKEYNFNIFCYISNKREPLKFNVKGIGYRLHNKVYYKNKELSANFRHQINFKNLFVHEVKKESIFLENKGNFNFEFNFDKKSKEIQIEPDVGSVAQNEKKRIDIIFRPEKQLKLQEKITLNILSGSSYHFDILGKSKIPKINLSKKQINFGKVLVTENSQMIYKSITISNKDKKALTLNTNYDKNMLSVDLNPSETILSGQSLSVKIGIKMRKVGKFEKQIIFQVNDHFEFPIMVLGQGVSLKVYLENPKEDEINFGQLKPKQIKIKNFSIKNDSYVPIKFTFENETIEKMKENALILSHHSFSIPKKSSQEFQITYKPIIRQRFQSILVYYQINEQIQKYKLMKLNFSCSSSEVKILEQEINFKSIVVSSSIQKKFSIVNLGDLRANYEWDLGFMDMFFAIEPSQGSIGPNQRLEFKASFSPKTQDFYKVKAKLNIDQYSYVQTLKLKGKGCGSNPDDIQIINIETPVRRIKEQQISIDNKTENDWLIEPVLKNDPKNYFIVPKQIGIKTNSTQYIKIIYNPQNYQKQDYVADLFFPLKNGKAIQYSLIGKILEPQIEGEYSIDLQEKIQREFSFEINNWMKKKQTMRITMENLSDDRLIVYFAKQVDLGALQSTQFRINLLSVVQGDNSFQLRFSNVKTQDYMMYKFITKTTEGDYLDTIKIQSMMRKVEKGQIYLQNYLKRSIIIKKEDLEYDESLLRFDQYFPIKIGERSEFKLLVQFRPLVSIVDKETQVVIKNEEIGKYAYKVILNSLKSNFIQTINFKAQLGESSTQYVNIDNFLTEKIKYNFSFEDLEGFKSFNDFSIQNKDIEIKEATRNLKSTLSVPVIFTPSKIGGSQKLLKFHHERGGHLLFKLVGICDSPIPKGPYSIPTKGYQLQFYNPFSTQTKFFLTFGNQNFTTSKNEVTFPPQKTSPINIHYKPGIENKSRLTVETQEGIQWIFYLKGVN